MTTRTTGAFALPGLLVLSALVGCGGDAGAPVTDDLVGRSFVVSGVDGHTTVDGTEITVAFDEDVILVNAGCNSMRGGYSVDGGTLAVSALAATRMMCEDALMEQEAWVSTFLSSAPTIDLDDGTMTLTSDSSTMTLDEVA